MLNSMFLEYGTCLGLIVGMQYTLDEHMMQCSEHMDERWLNYFVF